MSCQPYTSRDYRDVFTYIASNIAATHVIHGRVTRLLTALPQLTKPTTRENPYSAKYPQTELWNISTLDLALGAWEGTLWDHATNAYDVWKQEHPTAFHGVCMLFEQTVNLSWAPAMIRRVIAESATIAAIATCHRAVREYEALASADQQLATALRCRRGIAVLSATGWLAPSPDAELGEGNDAL